MTELVSAPYRPGRDGLAVLRSSERGSLGFPSGSGDSRAEAQGRGGVFDQPIGVGRFHALRPTFFGLFSVIPIR
jgi:hypothetical protein